MGALLHDEAAAARRAALGRVVSQKTQLIFTDNPGALPASYRLPPGLEVVVSSIFARFNGAGASGDFVPTLDILSQSGQLMARVAVSQTLTPGDSARVTWAPFLRKVGAASPPPSGSVPLAFGSILYSGPLVVATGTLTDLTTVAGGTFGGVDPDPNPYIEFSGGYLNLIEGSNTVFSCTLTLAWNAPFAANRLIQMIPGAGAATYPGGSYGFYSKAGFGQYDMLSFGFHGGGAAPNNNLIFNVQQDSGVNQTLITADLIMWAWGPEA